MNAIPGNATQDAEVGVLVCLKFWARLPSTCLPPLLRADKSALLGTAIHEEGDIVVAVDSARPPPPPWWLQQILNLLDSVTDLC